MANNSMKEIAGVLLDAKTVLIFPHINIDGDAIGSASALCKALRNLGKTAYILMEDDIPGNLKFLDKGYCTDDLNVIKDADISICVDCGDFSRFPLRKEKFLKGRTTICVDHHRTTKEFCDYNYVDSNAAATGELIFELLQEMGIKPDVEIGEAIFAAIATDTGNFQYSNTTRNCHIITAELFNWSVDINKVSVELYENERLEKLMITIRALNTMELVANGKGIVAYVTLDDLRETGAEPSETDGVIDKLRSISGVEYAAFIKEKSQNVIRVSLRAKRLGDVAEIAVKYGGGGHIKAAGCTLEMPIEEAVDLIKNEFEEAASKL